MTGYDFHPEAAIDLDEIWEFIAEDNLDAADTVITGILAAIDALAAFPHQGHRRPDLTSRPLRFILALDYLIAYPPDEKPLWVVAVMHGRRSPRVMAAILILRARIVFRSSIPFADRAFRDLAARAATLPDLIREVERWRNRLMHAGFSTLVSGSLVTPAELRNDHILGVYDSTGRSMLLDRILGALKADTTNGDKRSLSEAIRRVDQMLRETEATLSRTSMEVR
jgi:toxin ParE1/3/4